MTFNPIDAIILVEQFNINHVFYQDPVKNTLMDNSQFIRLQYCSCTYSMNGVYLYVPIVVEATEKCYNKTRCTFDKAINANIVQQLINIEREILFKVMGTKGLHKTVVFRMGEQLDHGNIKVMTKSKTEAYVLKIFGVWESETEIGLTFKLDDYQPVSLTLKHS